MLGAAPLAPPYSKPKRRGSARFRSENAGVTRALAEAFNLRPEELLIPEQYAWCSAIGTAILEAEETRKRSILEIHRLRQHDSEVPVQDSKPLSTENVIQLRDRVGVYTPPPDGRPIPAYLDRKS